LQLVNRQNGDRNRSRKRERKKRIKEEWSDNEKREEKVKKRERICSCLLGEKTPSRLKNEDPAGKEGGRGGVHSPRPDPESGGYQNAARD